MKFLFKTGCFILFSFFLWVNVFAASGPIIVNVDIPSGQWKAARLRNLPKDAMVAVKVESNGEILVALMLMLNQKSRALGAADFAVKNPSAFNTITKLLRTTGILSPQGAAAAS